MRCTSTSSTSSSACCASSGLGAISADDAALPVGLLPERDELVDVLRSRQGLTVVVADPWSGASAILADAAREAAETYLLVDARRCSSVLDLAMAIADGAIAAFASEALSWWLGNAAGEPLSVPGIEAGLRRGEDARLSDALDMVAALGGTAPILILDHLGRALSPLPPQDAGDVLAALRAARERHPALDLLLVDRPGGVVATALAGTERVRLRRPTPDRIVRELTLSRPVEVGEAALVRKAAELAVGVPELTWRIVEMAPATGDPAARATAGWSALRRASEGAVRREWDLLRRVHDAAQPVVAALARGIKPHAVPVESVDAALERLRDTGIAWRPAERSWALADPLLAAWARDHAPPWAQRATAYSSAASSSGSVTGR